MTNTTYNFSAPKTDAPDRDRYVHVATVAAAYGITATELKDAAADIVAGPTPPTPADWVVAASRVTNKCEKCSGRGVYYWGAVLNGKPSHSGDCFACSGTGTQDHADRKRCLDYWAFGVRVAV